MNDDELRQALAALDAYKNQLNTLTQQSQFLQMTMNDTAGAIATLKAFADAKEGDEILVPVGASTFVTAKVTSSTKAVVNIGSKVSVDKSLEDATDYMNRNLEEIKDAVMKISQSIDEMNVAATELANAVQEEYQRRQQ